MLPLVLGFTGIANANKNDISSPYGFWVSKTVLAEIMPLLSTDKKRDDLEVSKEVGEHNSQNVESQSNHNIRDASLVSVEEKSKDGHSPSGHNAINASSNTILLASAAPPSNDAQVKHGNKNIDNKENVSSKEHEAKGDTKAANKKSGSAPPMGHGFMMNRSPLESVYLMVKGGSETIEAPEVFYRFTARTLERHGGVPLASSYYKAKVLKDENGLWRADLIGNKFGTIEVYSRYKIGDETVYSQFNFLHFMTSEEEDPDSPKAESVDALPTDWPVFLFPASKYNEMPFRGTQTENTVDFDVLREGKPVIAEKAYLVETKKNFVSPEPVSFDNSSGKFSLSPADDPTLAVSSGPMGGMSGSKNMVALVKLPSNEVMTFTLSVTRSKWSYRKLGLGLILILSVAVVVGIVTADKRRRFKYNESN
jgi:hypothetical protein